MKKSPKSQLIEKPTKRTTITIVLILIATINTQPVNPALPVTNPFTKTQKFNITVSPYPAQVKFKSAAFLNNIGDEKALTSQMQNLTNISNSLLTTTCSVWQNVLAFILPLLTVMIIILSLITGGDTLRVIHFVEFCQEIFIITWMNIVREPCLYEYGLSLKTFFFALSERNNVLKNSQIMMRIFFQSVYFLENTAEIWLILSSTTFLYMVAVSIHLMLYQPNNKQNPMHGLEKLVRPFEFGFFFRLIQAFLTPITYFCFWGLRKFAFPNITAVFDTVMAMMSCLIVAVLLFVIMFVLNFIQVDMEEPTNLKRYGALYRHIKYKRERKTITNEAFFRSVIKIAVSSMHGFGFISATSVCYTGILFYSAFTIYIIFSLRIEGLYTNIYSTFKMILFHFVVMVNYIFAAFQVNRTNPELSLTSSFIQLLNTFTIFVLIGHCFAQFLVLTKGRNLIRKPKMDRRRFEDIYEAYYEGGEDLNVRFLSE